VACCGDPSPARADRRRARQRPGSGASDQAAFALKWRDLVDDHGRVRRRLLVQRAASKPSLRVWIPALERASITYFRA
jgi:hypothetical protein